MKRGDFIFIGGVLAIALCLLLPGLLRARNEKAVAYLYQNNTLLRTIDLTTAPDETILVDGDYPLTCVIKDHAIGLQNATCPDKRCQQYGMLNRSGQSAICLPNRTYLVIGAASLPEDGIIRVQI